MTSARIPESGSQNTLLVPSSSTTGFQETGADGYVVHGVVRILGQLDDPQGSVTFRVVVPSSDTSLAARILDSAQLVTQ